MLEYTGGPEVAEVDDPSVEEERALELRQQEAAKAADEMDQMEEDDEDDE
jgi:radial spoke head protein 4A